MSIFHSIIVIQLIKKDAIEPVFSQATGLIKFCWFHQHWGLRREWESQYIKSGRHVSYAMFSLSSLSLCLLLQTSIPSSSVLISHLSSLFTDGCNNTVAPHVHLLTLQFSSFPFIVPLSFVLLLYYLQIYFTVHPHTNLVYKGQIFVDTPQSDNQLKPHSLSELSLDLVPNWLHHSCTSTCPHSEIRTTSS